MPNTMDLAWHRTFLKVLSKGSECAPRGKKILELDHHTIEVNMNFPVLRLPQRKLNYRFMAAEALWIVTGRDDVAFLDPYNARMRDFSDNGTTLAGAYGPRIISQLASVLLKLYEDRDTRQATLAIWYPNPKPSKDMPCTVAMDFKIRDNRLNLHVFMRSSDVWLGLPYDVFSFTMVACVVVAAYNAVMDTRLPPIELGTLFLTAASSHLYEEHWTKAVAMVANPGVRMPIAYSSCLQFVRLIDLKDTKKGDPLRWWEQGLAAETAVMGMPDELWNEVQKF